MLKILILTILSLIGIYRVEAIDHTQHGEFNEAALQETLNAHEVVSGAPTKEEEVTFYLFKPGSSNYTQFYFQDPAIAANLNGRIYFLVHGWWESREKEWYADLTKALLKTDPTSYVIQVDWSGPASSNNYATAVYSTEDVGRILANLIHKLVKRCYQDLENVVLIGHSLGGQIVGFAGKGYKVLNKRKKRLPRIIALDPAGPIYIARAEARRLNREDADDVVIFHTDGNALGVMAAIGTIDFFPNGGYAQPGCFTLTCSHFRSFEMFVEAVNNPDQFPTLRCDSWSNFKKGSCGNKKIEETIGNALWTTKDGRFYSRTHSKSPFSKPLGVEKSLLSRFGL